ncbi:helix-turn-helix domain-containing protein [Weissella cibaria]|uniref:helix-turn-helix domain-containing protein n=1 Tax=Weissella cibaria TaxID=137591 RepID=UPI0016814D2E|nr:helix-turn-helix transcriptional regulator [Weissella cibaria]MBD1501956.1 XRE family transcriptional regulator [Weissella cibaria]
MTLFERVKEISKKHGFSSLRVLSEQAGLSPNVIYGWKTKEPSAKTLQAVADVLGVSVDYLLGNTDEMHSHKKDDKTVDLEQDTTILALDGIELSDDYKQFIIDQVRSLRKLRGDNE